MGGGEFGQGVGEAQVRQFGPGIGVDAQIVIADTTAM